MGKLTPVSELLGLSSDRFIKPENRVINQNNTIHDLHIEKLLPFKRHPFRPYTASQMNDLVSSIKEMGVITPILVRPAEDMYEILSGHNRVNACKIAGISRIKAIIIENISDDEAIIIVTESNFFQRSINEMLASELAKSLKMQLDACKKVGKKRELFSEIIHHSNQQEDWVYEEGALSEPRGKSVEKVAIENKMSRANIQRYIRLNFLISELLSRVDNGEIALYAAVDLSYLKQNDQHLIEGILKEGRWNINMKKAKDLRKFSKKEKFTEEVIREIITGSKKINRPGRPPALTINPKLISRFFPGEQKDEEITDVIDRALTMYFAKQGKEAGV